MNNNIPERITKIYQQCNEQEQQYLKQILYELATTGESPTYNDIWLTDYKEIPVDIDTFLDDEYYLGKSNNKGQRVYPFWRKELHSIFDNGNKFEEIFFTGATRIGKSSTAITATAYMLYRLMCLRDPQTYFNKKEISKFSILFFNVTKELAKGVAFREFNDTLKVSPWFNEHGKFSRSERDFYYIPEGDKVVIDYGSDAAHALGMQVFVGFCVVGSTEILTPDGYKRIEDLARKHKVIAQYNETTLKDNKIEYYRSKIIYTKRVCDTIQIELDNGTVFEGTPEHLVMHECEKYIHLRNINVNDKLLCAYSDKHVLTVTNVKKMHYPNTIKVYDVISAIPHHNFICKGGIVAHNCDEINFGKAGVKDVSKAKAHMLSLYNTVSARVKGTFRLHGEVYGKIFAVSSKNSDSDFMETYIQEQLASGAGDHMYVIDQPQWEVLPPETFSKERFYIAVGNRHQKGFVVPDNQTFPEALEDLRQQGYTLLNPPIDMKSNFLADFDIALRDLAGISVPGSLSFITQDTITSCINKERKNPFYNEILSIGTKDTSAIEDYFHIEDVDMRMINNPCYIHLDLSKNTDRSGISCICISGRKDIKSINGKLSSYPIYTHLFSIALEALRGDTIPYAKITQFLLWLRSKGFNIRGISRDQFQSEYMAQLLEAQGFSVSYRSLDRTPDGYIAFKAILSENRIDLLDVDLLQNELIHLQRDSLSGKVDHPIGGSKDVADSIAGACWNASLDNPPILIHATTLANTMTKVNKSGTKLNASFKAMSNINRRR